MECCCVHKLFLDCKHAARRIARNAEEVWQVYVKKLGYREPCFPTGTQSGTRYKVNITTWHAGYWEGGDTYNGRSDARALQCHAGWSARGSANIGAAARIDARFSNAFLTPRARVPGSWWEGHANYGRERWFQHYGTFFASNAGAPGRIDPTYLKSVARRSDESPRDGIIIFRGRCFCISTKIPTASLTSAKARWSSSGNNVRSTSIR